jgi:anti-sigma factor RsiW
MDCATLLQHLSAYIDQELDADLAEEARLHLATCQNCSVVLDSTLKTILIYHNQQKLTIPAERRQGLYRQLEAAFAAKAIS